MELRLVASLALESELSLHESGHRFREMAQSAPVPLIYSRADGSFAFVNQAWLDFSGRTDEQERAGGWVSLVHPDHRKRVREEWRRAFDSQDPFTAEAPLRRCDGVYRRMLGKAAPLFREEGSFDGYIGCLIDIDEYTRPPL